MWRKEESLNATLCGCSSWNIVSEVSQLLWNQKVTILEENEPTKRICLATGPVLTVEFQQFQQQQKTERGTENKIRALTVFSQPFNLRISVEVLKCETVLNS